MNYTLKHLAYFLIGISIFKIDICPAQNLRLELPAKMYKDQCKVFPLGPSGIIISQEYKHQIRLLKYDRSFQKTWQIDIPSHKKYSGIHYYFSQQKLYILLNKPYQPEIKILVIDLREGTFKTQSIYTVKNLKIKNLYILHKHLYISAKVDNQSVFLHIDIPKHKTKTFSFEGRGELLFNTISIDTLHQTVHLPVTHFYRGVYTTTLYTYLHGKPTHKIKLPHQENKNLINAQWLPLARQTYFIVGNYNHNIQREISQGLFTGQINPQQSVNTLKFYDYASNKNYFGYLNKANQEAMWAKILKIQQMNKVFQMRYRSQPQKIQRYQDQIIVIDNAFDTNLSQQNYSSTRPPAIIPNGWYYSHTAISAFDLKGKFLWTHAIDIDQLKSELDHHLIQTGYLKDTLISAFLRKDEIYYQKHHIQGNSFEKYYQKIRCPNSAEKITQYAAYQIKSWYQDKFLYWGFQKINSLSGRREVFFVEAIDL